MACVPAIAVSEETMSATSTLTGLSSVPWIAEVRLDWPIWNLDENTKQAIVGLKGVKITFFWTRPGSSEREREEGGGFFWRSLPFVRFATIDWAAFKYISCYRNHFVASHPGQRCLIARR